MTPEGAYVLWGGGPSRSLLVEAVLAEAGAAYELRNLACYGGDTSMEDFAAVNPFGWIPVLETPVGPIAETPAITTWLCEHHGLGLIPPAGDRHRAAYLTAFHNVIGEVEPVMKRVFFAHRYVLRPEDTEPMRAMTWDQLAERLAPLEQMLTSGPWLTPAGMTLADLHLGYWMRYGVLGKRLGGLPNITAHSEAVRAHPPFTPVFERLEAAILAYMEKVKRSS